LETNIQVKPEMEVLYNTPLFLSDYRFRHEFDKYIVATKGEQALSDYYEKLVKSSEQLENEDAE
jgi:hypothetical protein